MKKVLIYLFCSLLLASCISSDHLSTKMDFEGYVERMLEIYYSDAVFYLDRDIKSDKYTYVDISDDEWLCTVKEDTEDVVSTVKVIISKAGPRTVYIEGTRTEPGYYTVLSTLPPGITEGDTENFKVEVYNDSGTLLGSN